MNAVCTTFGPAPIVAELPAELTPEPAIPSFPPFTLVPPCSNSGLLCTGGRIVTDVGDVSSMASPWGDSDDISGDGKWFPRDFGRPGAPLKGLRGGASKSVLMAKSRTQSGDFGGQDPVESLQVQVLSDHLPTTFAGAVKACVCSPDFYFDV